MLCGACNSHLKGKAGSDGDVILCSKCPKKYHSLCLKLTREENKAIRQIGNKYVCPGCKANKQVIRNDETPVRSCPPNTRSEPANRSDDPGAEFLNSAQALASLDVPTEVLASFTSAIQQLQRVFENMKREMNDFTTSLNHSSEDVAVFRREISDMKNQLKEQEFYKAEVKNLRAEVIELRQELESREQQRLLKNVEITGLTEASGENLQQVVNTICVKLGVRLDPCDIDDVRRVGLRGGGPGGVERPRPVILTLTRRAPRDQILRAARVRRGLTTDMLDMTGNPRRVYLNEHLTKTNRILFSKARAAGAQLKFKFVWSSNGNIYMRRSETSSVVRVLSDATLEKLCKEGGSKNQSEGFQNTQD